MKIEGSVCPRTNGCHKLKVWQDKEAKTSGVVCVRCSRIFIWIDKELVSWWEVRFHEGAEKIP